MSNLANWIGGWHDNWPRLRQAVQTTVAACLAYAAAELVNAPQGFWAVMTAILVTQANVGASLGLAVDRLLGSLLGVIVGGAVALAIADHQSSKYLALALTVLVLAFFSARRPPFRIACVTAAIVILGDPRFGPPLSSAGYRMLEVTIGASISVLTSLMLFPSRAGPAFAEHVERMLPMLFQTMAEALACALGKPRDEKAIAEAGLKIRAAFAAGDVLAKETRLEVAGFLAEHPDPDAVLRALRRLWHTDIMLLRAVAEPLPASAIGVLRPNLERLCAAVAALPARYAQTDRGDAAPDLSPVIDALAALERAVAQMRERGELRTLPLDDVLRLMTFDFALGQLRANLIDLAARNHDLANLTGTAIPWLRNLTRWAKI
ncbi:MAG TPA: FUSC family protein [Hyphomicrobium sp.]|nr:FUSC family protein [Hyphomicrobium sp.]